MTDKFKKYLAILALGVSGGSIYLLPFIKYVFYDQQIAAMGITNEQSGLLLTMYAIGNMILYIPGGIVADKLSPKKCLMFSLISTSLLSIMYGITMSYKFALVIWLLFSITTVLVFWASLMKAVSIIGDSDEKGRMFGVYYAVNGITGTIANSLALYFSNSTSDPKGSLFNVVMVYTAFTILAAVLVFFFLNEKKGTKVETLEEDKFRVQDVVTSIKNPNVWIFSFIIFAGYSIYTSVSYFTPYLTDVVGVSVTQSGIYSIIRNYLFMLLGPISGYIADKVFKSTSKWFIVGFGILAILYLGVLLIPSGTNATLVSIYTLLPGAVGLGVYAIVFSIITEAKIPSKIAGTAIGIASIIGYSPDFFMSTMFGRWLDKFGNSGYTYIFIFLASVCVVGALAALYIRKISSKKKEENFIQG